MSELPVFATRARARNIITLYLPTCIAKERDLIRGGAAARFVRRLAKERKDEARRLQRRRKKGEKVSSRKLAAVALARRERT